MPLLGSEPPVLTPAVEMSNVENLIAAYNSVAGLQITPRAGSLALTIQVFVDWVVMCIVIPTNYGRSDKFKGTKSMFTLLTDPRKRDVVHKYTREEVQDLVLKAIKGDLEEHGKTFEEDTLAEVKKALGEVHAGKTVAEGLDSMEGALNDAMLEQFRAMRTVQGIVAPR